jgi:hypothetical protein
MRVHSLREPDAFLQRLDDFLVILPIRGRLIETFAIEQRDAAPAIDECFEAGCSPLPRLAGVPLR